MVNTVISDDHLDHDAAFTDSESSSSFDDADSDARTVDEEAELVRWRHNAQAIRTGAIKFLARTDEHAMNAAMTVVDIYEGRLDNGLYTNSRKAPEYLRIFKLHTSDAWTRTFVGANLTHCALAFWSDETNGICLKLFLSAAELTCIAVYFVDMYMKAYYVS